MSDEIEIEAAFMEDNAKQEKKASGGSSTIQTAFNTANVIMGVSLLALPMALRYTGWLIGYSLLIIFALVSSISAKLLAKCQDFYLRSTGVPLLSYGDIGEAAFGPRGRWFIQTIFTCELFSASVALFLLITKSLHDITGDLFTEIELMFIIWSVMTITTWPKSLGILSIGSVIGILCIVNLIVVIYFDGFYKTSRPGSLIEPAETSLLPTNWLQVPLSFGLFMAGYAGHACFPGFYASMKQPKSFSTAVNIAYSSGLFVYLALGSAGYLMFGDQLYSMITKNLDSPFYPRTLYFVTMALIIINPATKYPLTLYPIVLDLEALIFGSSLLKNLAPLKTYQNSRTPRSLTTPGSSPGISIESEDAPLLASSTTPEPIPKIYQNQMLRRIAFRTFVSALVLLTALVIPQFERVVQLLGSFFSITSSILFPIMCYLAFFKSQPPSYSEIVDIRSSTTSKWNDPNWLMQTDPSQWVYVSKWSRILAMISFVFFACLGITGTIWAILPESLVPRR